MKQTRLWVAIIAVLLCGIAINAQDFNVGSFSYKITSETDLTVEMMKYQGYSYAATIPETVTYNNNTYRVTSIGSRAFEYCSNLISITIPKNVISIKSFAFYYCENLTTITIPESVIFIGYKAFDFCSDLQNIHIGSVESWLNIQFDGNYSRPNYRSSGKYYFYMNGKLLTNIEIPSSVTTIPESAFMGCTNLTSLTLHAGVTSIGGFAFYGCSSLYKLINNSSLSLASESSNHGYVAYYTKEIINASELTTVDDFQFLTSNDNHFLVNYIGSDTIIVLPDNYNEEEYSIGNWAFYGCSDIKSITVSEGTMSIKDGAFSDCVSLNTITVPQSVTSIGNYAFDNCSSLKEIILEDGNGILSLGYNYCSDYNSTGQGLFYDCPLASVYLGRNLSFYTSKYYGYSPFFNKLELTYTAIGDSVTLIGENAFSGCSSLADIHTSSIEAWCNISFGNSDSNPLCYGHNLYLNGELVTELMIPEGVTSIGNYAFYGCSSLTSISIPESVASIGVSAFYDCNRLHSVTVGSGVLSIGSNAFSTSEKVIWLTNTPPSGYSNAEGCINYVANDQYTSLNNVKVYPYLSSMFEVDGVKYVPVSPSERTCHAIDCVYGDAATAINVSETASFKGVAMKVTEVMPYAFYGNDHIKEVSVSHLGNIGERAFYSCDGIKSVTVSNNGDIGEQAFYNCDVIETVNVSNQGDIGKQAFYNCDGIKSVTASNSGDIGEQAFYNCDAIETVNVSNQGNIGNQAFYDCNGIKSVDICNQGSIGGLAFYGCNGMQVANIANIASAASFVDDTPLTFADWTSTNKAHSSTSSETYTFTAGEGATLSFSWAVSSEASYDKLIVTLDGTTILEKSGSLSGTYSNTISKGSHTLVVKYTKDSSNSSGSDQASVSNITVSKGDATTLAAGVGSEAFSGCSSLKTVTLGDSIGSLGHKAFYQCSSLQEIAIPDSVKSVDSYCFSGCSVMKSAVIGNGLTDIKEYTFADCGLEEILIGDNITSIGDYAFKGCTGMKHAVLGNGLTIVNGTMFSGCIGLEKVEMGNKIRTLAANAFSGCSALKDVALGSSVATINNYAFQGCSSLPEITLPQAVTKVGDYVFAGCSKLADVMIADRTTALALGSNGSSPLFADCPLDSVYIGGKITYSTTSSYGYSPFYRNTSLRTVVITDREEQIYENEFYGCTNLKNVTIGNGVKSIGNYAFSGCSSLDKFAFGSSMQRIGEEAFSDCTNLTEICSSAMNPPTCGTQALDDINKWNCILKVPTGYMAAYQAADQWKEFFFIEDIVEVATYTLTFMVDGEVYHTMELPYEAAVTMPATPTKEGHTFSGWDKTLSTMPAEDVTISGTFTINKYLVTFKVDGEIVYSESLEYGASIVAPDVPEKEGHTFNGWGEVDTTVPAHDVTYEANYSVNSYQLTYVVDGETVQTESVAYGTAITLIDEPVKEGYTFSGWGEVPETMPAHDVTLNGAFTVNRYLVTFTVDGAVIASDSLEYGTAITVPTMPEREGYTFSGWSEVAETVPAHDVTYDAIYTANIYKVYYFVGATLVHTAEVAYGEAIPEYVYEPTAEGDVFMGWIGETYETMPAHDVTYTANITNDVLQLTNDNSQLTIYDLSGRKVTDTENLKGGIYIVNGKKVVIE